MQFLSILENNQGLGLHAYRVSHFHENILPNNAGKCIFLFLINMLNSFAHAQIANNMVHKGK